VTQEILNRHLARGRSALDPDVTRAEGRKVFRDGIRDQQTAFLVQLHGGHRDERLRHRRDPEDRVVSHGRAGRLVPKPDRFRVRDPPLARDDDHRPRKPPVLDVRAQHVPNPREPRP
jgi:hypothetical protein